MGSWSLAKGKFLATFSLAKGIQPKTGAVHPRQKFSESALIRSLRNSSLICISNIARVIRRARESHQRLRINIALGYRDQMDAFTNSNIFCPGGVEFRLNRLMFKNVSYKECWKPFIIFSFAKMQLKIPSAKWRPFCSGGDELSCLLGQEVLELWEDANSVKNGLNCLLVFVLTHNVRNVTSKAVTA